MSTIDTILTEFDSPGKAYAQFNKVDSMNRLLRYVIALLVGAAVTGGLALLQPQTPESAILLAGIAVVYTVGTAVAIPHWSALRHFDSPNWTQGAFTGATTFGCVMLMDGVTPTPNFAVAALGLGLSWIGFVAGIAFEHEQRTPS